MPEGAPAADLSIDVHYPASDYLRLLRRRHSHPPQYVASQSSVGDWPGREPDIVCRVKLNMLRRLKSRLLRATRATGFNRSLSNSEWRRNRLLILCYHGLSQDDEHEWNPGFFMSPQTFERRLEVLREGNYSVLPLSEAVDRLTKSTLPPRSVVLTFDDGMSNFQTVALPILRKFGYPATVYLRTDYCDYQRPVFHTVCPYILWKQRHSVVPANPKLGWTEAQDLRTQEGRERAWSSIRRMEEEEKLSDEGRDAVLTELARHTGLDYAAFLESRILHIMSPADISAIAQEGVDVQLHTHRHRLITTLGQGQELRTEIEENRKRILQLTGRNPVHLCYPSGKYSTESLPALRRLGIATATTCEPDLAARSSNLLLLPRYVDTQAQTLDSFDAWLSGVGSLLVRLGLSSYRSSN
jgi:peptidoglycan/xylan/chitin deacetylase (PgdA/CDA1 family)